MQKYGEDLCVARTGTQVEILTGSGKAVEMEEREAWRSHGNEAGEVSWA